MAGQSQGAISQLAINGQAMEFISIQDLSHIDLVDNGEQAIRGILDLIKERITQGLHHIRLRVTMQPSPAEMDVLWPLIGTAESPTDTFTVTDDFTSLSFATIVDRVAKVHTYATCYVDKALFFGQKGNAPIGLMLEIVGTSVSEGAAGSFSATGITTDIAYAFFEGTLTLQSSSRSFNQFALLIDNHQNVEFNNNQTASSICPALRTIDLGCSTPYTSSEDDLLTTPLSSAAGAAATLAWSRSGQSTSIALANVKPRPLRFPPVPGKREIRLPLAYRAYKSGSTAALIATHDATP